MIVAATVFSCLPDASRARTLLHIGALRGCTNLNLGSAFFCLCSGQCRKRRRAQKWVMLFGEVKQASNSFLYLSSMLNRTPLPHQWPTTDKHPSHFGVCISSYFCIIPHTPTHTQNQVNFFSIKFPIHMHKQTGIKHRNCFTSTSLCVESITVREKVIMMIIQLAQLQTA